MMEPKKNKEEIDIVIESKEKAFWLQVKKETEGQINMLEKRLKFEKSVLEMTKEKIKQAE